MKKTVQKHKSLFSAVLLGGTLLLARPFPASADDVIKNGSFLEGEANWVLWGGASSVVQVNGEARMHLVSGGRRQDVLDGLQPGVLYRLSGTALASSANAGAKIGVRFWDVNFNSLGDVNVPVSGKMAQNYSLDFTVPAGANRAWAYMLKNNVTSEFAEFSKLSLVRSDRDPKLKYAPPYVGTVTPRPVADGYTKYTLPVDRDAIFELPNFVKNGSLFVEGGRNIIIRGGHIRPNVDTSRAIYIKNNKGTVHIEGVVIEGSGTLNFDAITIDSPDTILQVQNVRILNVHGTHSGFHGDIIQPFSGLKELRVDRLTGSSSYQGLQLATTGTPIGSVELNRVNLKSNGAQTQESGGQLFWMMSANYVFDCVRQQYPVKLENVFLQGRPENGTHMFTHTVYPMRGQLDNNGVDCGGALSGDGTKITFPALPVTGFLSAGAPEGGDYVKEGEAGLNYISPGYQNQ